MTCGVVVALLLGFTPAVAMAQSVRGHVKWGTTASGSLDETSVNAWLDDGGGAHGSMVWVGGIVPGSLPKTGPADPWFIDVTDIVFDGSTAYVSGVVADSVFPGDIGSSVTFVFTDNSGTGEPDEIFGEPIVAGNITVDD